MGVMLLGNHEAGQVTQCAREDCYGSVTQTIAIFSRSPHAQHDLVFCTDLPYRYLVKPGRGTR